MSPEGAASQHVLVVEDEPDYAALLRSMLERAGYVVSIAHNGHEAFLQVGRSKPDIVTLDIQMPQQSGLLFYRRLKADDAYRSIPVVVLTGLTRIDHDWDGIIRSFLEADGVPPPDAYLEKPVEGVRLLEVVRSALSA